MALQVDGAYNCTFKINMSDSPFMSHVWKESPLHKKNGNGSHAVTASVNFHVGSY